MLPFWNNFRGLHVGQNMFFLCFGFSLPFPFELEKGEISVFSFSLTVQGHGLFASGNGELSSSFGMGWWYRKWVFHPWTTWSVGCLCADVHIANFSLHSFLFICLSSVIASHLICSWKVHNWTCKQKWCHFWFDQVKVLYFLLLYR